jgi:predicted acetyltransferase
MNDRIVRNISLSVDLVDARQSPTDRDWLSNVYPFYLHDLSEVDDGYYRLSNDGRWEPDHLPSWLADDTDYPFVMRMPRGRVGSALVNTAPSPHIMPGADYRLSEFFVLRAFRRAGVGRRAAFALFDRFPGIWEIRELPRNGPAIAFWRTTLGEYAGRRYEETTTHEEVRQIFDSRHRAGR